MTDIAFLLFSGQTQLDMTGPAQFLSRLPGGKVHYVAETLAPVPNDAGFSIVPTATFKDIASADILSIPGGIGVSDVMRDPMEWAHSHT